MQSQLKAIREQVLGGKAASLTFEAEGSSYIRFFRPRQRLILLGGGHIAEPLCRYGADLGFEVWVADDRASFANVLRFPDAKRVICAAFPDALRMMDINEEDYVAVITRGHRYDADCLRVILAGSFPYYLGMIGSERRVAGLFGLLEEEGFSPDLLHRIHAPIGLSINALTTKEIAISILAELIQCRRQDTPRNLRETRLVTEDIDLPLLEFAVCDREPKALLIVCETGGSTPVKSGAMMAVDRNLRTAGTIGGGCSEHAVLMKAHSLIGTGSSLCVTVDMSNDVAEEEGMVCGGWMKVFIADIFDPST